MISILTPNPGIADQSLQGVKREIYLKLQAARESFIYSSHRELEFELSIRANTIQAAIDLNKSEATFTSFQYSTFNPAFWVRSRSGYLLRPDVLPSHAIRDLFQNGKMYGFECSTAMVLVFYKAVLDSIRESHFNYLFNNLLVWNWNNDPDMEIITRVGSEFIPGDVIYFNNPDYREPIWRGANAVVLGGDQYYAHGIGIKTADEIIAALNTLRKDNATQSAYMLNQHSRLNVRYLYRFS